MRKYSIAIVILSILASPALAETVFSGWAFAGGEISAGGKSFILDFTNGQNDIVLRSSDLVIVVPFGQCRTEGVLDVCYGGFIFDTYAKKNKANLTISQSLPKISISRAINNSAVRQGEKTNFSVRIKNVGTSSADNIYFEDDLSGFRIEDYTGCEAKGALIFWRGTLQPNETRSCTYVVSGSELLEKTTKAKVTYSDNEERIVYSDAVSFKVEPLISLKAFLESEKIYLGNVTRVTVNISARNGSASIRSLRITLPKGLAFNGSVGETLADSGGAYLWNGSVSGNTSFFIYAKGTLLGYNEILLEAEYSFGGKAYRISERKAITIEAEEVVLSTSLASGERFDEASTKWIKVYVENKNRFSRIRNVRVAIDSPLFSKEPTYLSEINRSERVMVLYLKKTLPLANTSTKYQFNVNLSYETEFGEAFTKVLENSIYVEPISALEILKEFSPSSPRAEDTVTVTTKVRNTRNKPIYTVLVRDDSSPLSGASAASININASETATAYTYAMKMPYVREETEINITTSLSYSDDGKSYAHSKSFPIKVAKKDLKLDIARTIPSVGKGGFFINSYEVSNPGSEELFSIAITPSKQKDFDIVDTEYLLGNLAPGEKAKVQLEHKAKENGTATFSGERVSFRDSRGTEYEQNLSSSSMTVLASSTDLPIIYLAKTAQRAVEGEPASIIIDVTNKGGPVSFTLRDSTRSWVSYLARGASASFAYNRTFYDLSETDLSPAVASYSADGKDVLSYSERVKVDFVKRPKEEPKEIKTEAPKTDPAVPPAPPKEETEPAIGEEKEVKEGLVARFVGFIRFLLGR